MTRLLEHHTQRRRPQVPRRQRGTRRGRRGEVNTSPLVPESNRTTHHTRDVPTWEYTPFIPAEWRLDEEEMERCRQFFSRAPPHVHSAFSEWESTVTEATPEPIRLGPRLYQYELGDGRTAVFVYGPALRVFWGLLREGTTRLDAAERLRVMTPDEIDELDLLSTTHVFYDVPPFFTPAPLKPAIPILAYEDVDDESRAAIQESWVQDTACSICLDDLSLNDFSKRFVAVFHHGARAHFLHTECWMSHERAMLRRDVKPTCCNCRGAVDRVVELPPPPPNYRVCGCR